jgi:hypothetical protein
MTTLRKLPTQRPITAAAGSATAGSRRDPIARETPARA